MSGTLFAFKSPFRAGPHAVPAKDVPPDSGYNMETAATSSTVLSVADRSMLDTIARQLDDPSITSERLLEMLWEVTEMSKRYGCDFRLASD